MGKSATLNVAIANAHGEIIVFSDANSVYRKDALKELVRPFVDSDIGGVAGNQVYHRPSEDEGVIAGERRYWDIDRVLKRSQSTAGSAIGGTGAIYAVRRSLLSQIPDGVSDDFYNTLSVVRSGKRLVFAPDAVAYEWVSRSGQDEYARKVRVMVRGLRCVWVMRRLLNPLRYGFFAVQLFSQKVLTRAMALPLIIAAASALILARQRRFFAVAAFAQGLFYGLAAIGLTKGKSGLGRARIFTLPAYFCLVNVGSAQAWWRLLRGDKLNRWEPRR
jgi:cellulose synthase/poly-beta-1,6-N-acetylglucosamine synthase-like glycosyltransferase